MNEPIEFGVLAICFSVIGTYVEGRCYVGPIRLKDKFNCVYRLSPAETEEDYARKASRLDERKVALVVERIQIYGRETSEIEDGLTGRLFLSGMGTELVSPLDVLGICVPNDDLENPTPATA